MVLDSPAPQSSSAILKIALEQRVPEKMTGSEAVLLRWSSKTVSVVLRWIPIINLVGLELTHKSFDQFVLLLLTDLGLSSLNSKNIKSQALGQAQYGRRWTNAGGKS